MRRRFDSALPLIVLIGFAATALLVNRLLEDAQQQGIDALEDALRNEADAVASSQDQRLEAQFTGASKILFAPGSTFRFDLAVGSPADDETLSTLLGEVTQSLETGYYLVDSNGTVTQGFLLEDEGRIGEPFAWPGFEAAVGAPGFGGAVLPVSTGLTTGGPASAFVFPLGSTSPDGSGYFVFETAIEPDSDFSKEIRGLGRGETGEVLFYDGLGTVIAASDPGLIAETIDDDRMLTEAEGLYRFDDRVVAIAEVPVAGWRVTFRQDAEEFERPLAQPVESVGRILVLVLLAAGFLLTVMLYRRLRAARAEQERLRRLSEAQQELISIVSHELRTPVAGVLGFLETTLDHWDGMEEADRYRAVSRAATNARRLQAMTRDVLDTQSVETGRLIHVMEPLDLADEVRIAVDAAKEQDPERQFEVRVPDAAVWVSGDADRLQQVLANLLDNARKSSPAVEPIEVELNVDDGQAQVAIIDHGAGIEAESLDRIFEKFVRGRDEGVTGTGLGLYISRQILDAHGGSIWAESQGGGATFRFRLPVRSPAEVGES